MQITITARHLELNKSIRTYIENECDKLNRYFEHISKITLIITAENSRNQVEMKLHAGHHNLNSVSEDHDLYRAIDDAIEKMESQIKKLKEKLTNHQKRTGLKHNSQYVYSNLFEVEKKKSPRKVIKMKRIVAEPMQVNEAIDFLSENRKPYVIFLNIETDKINVLIKKSEQQFRLIEP